MNKQELQSEINEIKKTIFLLETPDKLALFSYEDALKVDVSSQRLEIITDIITRIKKKVEITIEDLKLDDLCEDLPNEAKEFFKNNI